MTPEWYRQRPIDGNASTVAVASKFLRNGHNSDRCERMIQDETVIDIQRPES
jgi:hypothetical protein